MVSREYIIEKYVNKSRKLFHCKTGMRDSGGHGGSSHSEVNVPLVYVGPPCLQTNDSYNQIDIPATLSVLFGLPIPSSSVGQLIPSLLAALSMEQKLYCYFYNGQRLLRKLSEMNGPLEKEGIRFFLNFNNISLKDFFLILQNFSCNLLMPKMHISYFYNQIPQKPIYWCILK